MTHLGLRNWSGVFQVCALVWQANALTAISPSFPTRFFREEVFACPSNCDRILDLIGGTCTQGIPSIVSSLDICSLDRKTGLGETDDSDNHISSHSDLTYFA